MFINSLCRPLKTVGSKCKYIHYTFNVFLHRHISRIVLHFEFIMYAVVLKEDFPRQNIPLIAFKEEGNTSDLLVVGSEYVLWGFLIQSRKTLSMECFHSGGNLFKITLNTI